MELEIKHTINVLSGQFLKYFETYKAIYMTFKVTLLAQKKAGTNYGYWWNPIEWSNHILKSETNENSEICLAHA